jgi:hypothetical protein
MSASVKRDKREVRKGQKDEEGEGKGMKKYRK